jgi:UrcA family protein
MNMVLANSRLVCLCAAGIVTAVTVTSATSAFAQPLEVVAPRPNFDETTRTVSYRDLDLASAEGRQALDRRVKAAVRGVCGGSTAGIISLPENRDRIRCTKLSWQDARPQIASAIAQASMQVAGREGGATIRVAAR